MKERKKEKRGRGGLFCREFTLLHSHKKYFAMLWMCIMAVRKSAQIRPNKRETKISSVYTTPEPLDSQTYTILQWI